MAKQDGFVAVLKDASLHVVNPDPEDQSSDYVTKIYPAGTVLLGESVRDVVYESIKAGKIPHLVLTDTEDEAKRLAGAAGAIEARTGEVTVTEVDAQKLADAGVGHHAADSGIVSTQGLTPSQVEAATV